MVPICKCALPRTILPDIQSVVDYYQSSRIWKYDQIMTGKIHQEHESVDLGLASFFL